VEAVNAAAGRPVGSVHVFDQDLFPFAHDFYDSWTEAIHAGKLPDGTQMIVQETSRAAAERRFVEATDPAAREAVVDGLAFDRDGPVRPEPFLHPLPPEFWGKGGPLDWQEQREWYRACKEFLRRAVGFEPAFVRVQGFDTDWVGSPVRFWDGVED